MMTEAVAFKYDSPLGEIVLQAEGSFLTGLWFSDQRYFACTAERFVNPGENEVLDSAREWLNIYFSGTPCDFTPPLAPRGSAFRQAVWQKLLEIQRGETATYGDIARMLGTASARAVGGAVGHNPISLIIPCHRVIGSGGVLTGYAGGIHRKKALLEMEGVVFDGQKIR